jgi:hypothetical protein
LPVKPGNDSTETHCLAFVMPGLVPGIHVLLLEGRKDVDGRDKRGHDRRGVGTTEEAVPAQLQIFSTTQPP